MSTSLVHKILDEIHRRRALDSANQAYTRGKGVHTAAIQLINHREDAEEKQTPLHQSSFDLKKNFDSTRKAAKTWYWQRVRVPKGAAKRMDHMDVYRTTVVRAPFAEAVWNILTYRCVQTPGEYPPHTVPVPPKSALLSSLGPKLGMGQGN